MADEDGEENRVVFTFSNRGQSPQPPWQRRRGRRRGRYHHIGPDHFDFDDSSSSDSGDSCFSSDSDYAYATLLPRPQHRHHHHHLHHHHRLPEAPRTTNRLVRPVVVAPAQPRSYGYRRIHVQGGQERAPRRTRRATHHSHSENHHRCQQQQEEQQQQQQKEQRKCILTRCCRWIFGDSQEQEQRSGGGGGGAQCYGGRGPQSRLPTHHREEEYWGPGTHSWAYGPPGANGGWRDTPWAGESGPGPGLGPDHDNLYNLAPGGVIEEIEEGGTLPIDVEATLAANQDTTHNHPHHGRGRRGRRSSFMREYVNLMRDRERDNGVLGLVDRERDRELDRNMVDRESASRRDLRMMALLDRERDRDRGGTDLMDLLDRELERRRDLRPEEVGKGHKARKESDGGQGGGLKAEIEALRKDFNKLLRNLPATKSDGRPKKGRRGVSGRTSVASRSSGQQQPFTAGDIDFSHGDDAASDDDGGDDDGDEDEDKNDESEGSESSWVHR